MPTTPKVLLRLKLGIMAKECNMVLDVGQSTRAHFSLFERQRIETMEVNRSEPLADIIDDICAPDRLQPGRYDGIVCLSVLEHVYDPFEAMKQIHQLLPDNGYLLLHLPFLFRYHAPADLQFTDGYRFSRDGLGLDAARFFAGNAVFDSRALVIHFQPA